MRKLIYLSLLYTMVISKTAAQDSARITQVETLNAQNLAQIFPDSIKRESAKRGLELIANFLQSKTLSGVDTTRGIAAELSNYLFKQFSAENLLFEIISINDVTSHKARFVVNTYMVLPNVRDRYFQGSFDLVVNLKNYKVVFPNYSADYTTLKYGHINFIVKESERKNLLANLKSSERFTSLLLQKIKKFHPEFNPPRKPVNYLVGGGVFNGLEYFGIHNYIYTSRFLSGANTIVDLAGKGYHKHELVHSLFINYRLSSFLNEGLATFLSGGEVRAEASSVNRLKEIQNSIKSDKDYARQIDTDSELLDFSFGEQYIISALLLQDYYRQCGPAKFYETVFKKSAGLNDQQFLSFLKQELKVSLLSDYLLNMQEPDWTIMNR